LILSYNLIYYKYIIILLENMAQLFKKNILKEKIENFSIPNFEDKINTLQSWHNLYISWKLNEKKETSIQWEYASHILGNVLWYDDFVENNEEWNRQNEPWNPTWWQSCDFWLGYFKSSKDFTKNKVKVVVEVKDSNTSLDKPQKRIWNLSPVQQAFKYKPFFKECDFIVVSNFFETRLYIDSYYDYEVWTLTDLVNPKNNFFHFRKFYYLLCKENFIIKKWESNTKSLLSYTRIREKEITKEFYKEYTLLRKELFKDIVLNAKKEWNPFKNKELDLVLSKTQKIIDRIIFIHFCEDLDLLPNGKLKEVVNYWEKSLSTTWETLQNFFRAVDKWSEKLWIPDGYNGWLFHLDEKLNKLKVWDEICKKFVDMWDYDFADDLSVNILGHIFEQSISDIEELKDKINKQEEVTLSKRKKDWVFYTPEYIVDYIVKNSVGKKIDEWEEELKEKHSLKENINDKNYTKRAITVYSDLQEKVQNIKVLDPACWSGAFLVKVFDFLLDKNKEISNKLQDLSWSNAINMFQTEIYFKNILQNNIYWVDLNEESVEITKLSLWLKTAQRGKKLANLDENIKCGNSLIDDPEIAWDKAFVWETEFGEIFDSGWFDIVVWNPPYVLCQPSNTNEKTLDYFKEKYAVASYKIDLYHLFFEKSINILTKWWELSFITPNTYFTNKYIINLRDFILSASNIKKVILFEDWVFEWASVDTSIILLQKNIINKQNIIFTWIMNTLWNIEEKESFNQKDFTKTENKEFNFNKTFNFDEILKNTLSLEEITTVTFWLQTKDKKTYVKEEKIWDEWEECYTWKDISRYFLDESSLFFKNIFEEVKAWGSWDMKYHKARKLVVRQVWWPEPIFAYDIFWFSSLNTMYNIVLFNKDFNIKYILSVLNSIFMKFYWKENFSDNKQLFPKIKWYQLKQIPIKDIPLSEQTPFIEKADFMLDKNKELQEKINKFLKRLQSSFEIEKLSKKLEKFYEWEFSDFIKELQKKKIVMSLNDQDEWEEYFDNYKKEIIELKNKIDN